MVAQNCPASSQAATFQHPMGTRSGSLSCVYYPRLEFQASSLPLHVIDKPSIPVLLGALIFAAWLAVGPLAPASEVGSCPDNAAELRKLEEHESQLRELVATNSATVVRTRWIFCELHADVARLGGADPWGHLTGALAAYDYELVQAEDQVEEYVLASNRLKRSIGALPAALAKLANSGLRFEAVEEFSSATNDLLCDALVSSGSLDADLADGLVGRINWFGQRADPAQVASFDLAAQAVRSAQGLSVARAEAIAAIDVEALRSARNRLVATNVALFEREARESQALEHTSSVLFASLFALLILSVLRMRILKAESGVITEELEHRVKDRTSQLVNMNQDLRDEMSERRRAELETRAAQTDAEVASQAKSEFLANMSHEIRTPMTAILGFSERLLDAELQEAGRTEAVETIRRNGEYLLQIINDILDLSKIEAGKLQIERITCPLVDSAKGVLDLLGLRASEKGLSLSVEFVGELPEFIETDTVRLRQILLNLVGNAIKFTRSGGVLLRIECVDEPYEMTDRAGNHFTGVKPFIKYSVIDTGIGLSEEQLAELFSPFMQADTSTTRTFGGTGLGLSISKSLCELLGGRISVVSTPGQGSRFTFTVDPGRLQGIRFVSPAAENVVPVPDLPQRAVEATVNGECRVLLAEDGVDNQRLIRYVLERAGIVVTIVGNGQQAMNHAMAGLMDGDPYDVVLMDMQMPVMDGYTAVRELRASGYDRPIVALTAHAMQTDREKCLEIGCDDFCPKPIDKRELIGIINSMKQRTDASAPSEPLCDEDEFDDFDDDPEMLELVNQFVDDLQADVVALRAAAERNDLDKITILSHQLKGCAGGYGFGGITELAARVEVCARDGDADGNLKQELEALCKSCQELKTR